MMSEYHINNQKVITSEAVYIAMRWKFPAFTSIWILDYLQKPSVYKISLILNFLCFLLTFSRSEIQSIALRLASKMIAHHMQMCEEVGRFCPLFWGLGCCAPIYLEGISKSELFQQAELLWCVCTASTKILFMSVIHCGYNL